MLKWQGWGFLLVFIFPLFLRYPSMKSMAALLLNKAKYGQITVSSLVLGSVNYAFFHNRWTKYDRIELFRLAKQV